MKRDINKTVNDIMDSCFITNYSNSFNKFLQKLSPETREVIRKNKELNEMYDLFLDFTIDASQYLDYILAKESEKNID